MNKQPILLALALIIAGTIGPTIAYATNPTLAGLAGHWAASGYGTETLCWDSGFSMLESCSTTGAVALEYNLSIVGNVEEDAVGNTCGVQTVILAPDLGFPQQIAPSTYTNVCKVTSYNQVRGVVKATCTNYSGGSCTGATFNSSGATVNATWSFKSVVSQSGARADGIDINLTAADGVIGASVIHWAAFKQ
jgi:hypothetical protein